MDFFQVMAMASGLHTGFCVVSAPITHPADVMFIYFSIPRICCWVAGKPK